MTDSTSALIERLEALSEKPEYRPSEILLFLEVTTEFTTLLERCQSLENQLLATRKMKNIQWRRAIYSERRVKDLEGIAEGGYAWALQATKVERQRDSLLKALEPFAKFAKAASTSLLETNDTVLVMSGENALRVTCGDLTQALVVHAEITNASDAADVVRTAIASELTTLLQRCEKAEDALKTSKDLNQEYNKAWNAEIDRAELAERQRDEALKALEPFVRDLDNWTDDNGWTAEAPKNDRICDWFGPSDFRAARNAMGEPE